MNNLTLSDAESNANKENEDQGNAEILESKEQKTEEDEMESDLELNGDLNEKDFDGKYSTLQKQWLEGHLNREDLDPEQCKKYGEHDYILQYLLPQSNPDAAEIVFHPKYAYSYTSFEKECVLPKMSESQLKETKIKFECHIDRLEKKILKEISQMQREADEKEKEKEKEGEAEKDKNCSKSGWVVPEFSIPIRADIRSFDFVKLADEQKKLSGRLFDVIMTDPPWQLATANPTRGVAIGYNQLEDNIISSLPIHLLQDNGLIFIWVINAKYRLALNLFKKWGYTMIADIAWVKQTVNRRIANGHGYYLQHAKETCLIGLKGDFVNCNVSNKLKGMCSDIIYSQRRGQSQKPTEIYQYIEQVIPNGFYMEIFGRRNNLRNGWLTIGNEL